MISFLFWEIFICTVPYRFFSCIVAHLFSFIHLLWISYLFLVFVRCPCSDLMNMLRRLINCRIIIIIIINSMALNSLHCAEMPLRNCSLTHSCNVHTSKTPIFFTCKCCMLCECMFTVCSAGVGVAWTELRPQLWHLECWMCCYWDGNNKAAVGCTLRFQSSCTYFSGIAFSSS